MQVTVIYNTPTAEDQNDVAFTDEENQSVAQHVAQSLEKFGYKTDLHAVSEKNLYYLKSKKTDAFFNMCDSEGLYMRVVKHLAKHGCVFTGPGIHVMALTVDKVATKRVFVVNNIPTPQWQYMESENEQLDPSLRFPLIVKPFKEDCSIGITRNSVVYTESALREAIQKIRETYHQGSLIETFIPGIELHCTVLGNGKNAVTLPLAELRLPTDLQNDDFVYDYAAKWDTSSPYNKVQYVSPAPSISIELSRLIRAQAKRAFVALEMRDYGRFDIRFNQQTNKWFFLEANSNPSINPTEATAASAKAYGFGYETFVKKIFESCIKRNETVPAIVLN